MIQVEFHYMKLNKINSSVIEVNVIDIGHPTLLTNVLVVWWLDDCQDGGGLVRSHQALG